MMDSVQNIWVIVRCGDVETSSGITHLSEECLAEYEGVYAPFFTTLEDAESWLKTAGFFTSQMALVQRIKIVRLKGLEESQTPE